MKVAQGSLKRLRIKTTLVVVPPYLVRQWVVELERHAPQLNVCTFSGSCKGPEIMTQAYDFASRDVVITSFEVVKAECNVG